MAKDYGNIGLMYYDTGDYPKALEYYNKAREIDESLNNRVGMAQTNYNLSFAFYKMNEKSKALDYLSIGQGILTELMEGDRYTHPLLKDIESRITLIKQEQFD